MPYFLIAILVVVAVTATGVVFTRETTAQCIAICFFGLLLAVMFMAFQAPDVALSQLVIGAVGLPLMVLLALATLRRDASMAEKEKKGEHP